jgi:hypothetical protein
MFERHPFDRTVRCRTAANVVTLAKSSPSRGAPLPSQKESAIVMLDLGLIVGEAGSAATDIQLSVYVPVRGE